VKRGRQADLGDIRLFQRVAFGRPLQLSQHHLRKGADMYNMLTAFPISKFHDVAENIDQRIAQTFFFVDLVHHKTEQFSLLGVQ